MVVLDASALIALVRGEAGSAAATGFMHDARISSVNYSEFLSSLGRAGLPFDVSESVVEALQVEVLPFTMNQARIAARISTTTASSGLSLGDRACLAVAVDLGEPAITADRVWADIDVSAEVILVR